MAQVRESVFKELQKEVKELKEEVAKIMELLKATDGSKNKP